jgi:hypothetical protein
MVEIRDMATQPATFIQPNLYDLSGAGLHITYSTTGIDGKPHFTYHSGSQTLIFVGDQIQTTQSPLGTLVTVFIVRTVDSGSTTFTLLVPRANLNNISEHLQITTDGIIALHRFSLIHALMHGQLDRYTVHALHGTASHVQF